MAAFRCIATPQTPPAMKRKVCNERQPSARHPPASGRRAAPPVTLSPCHLVTLSPCHLVIRRGKKAVLLVEQVVLDGGGLLLAELGLFAEALGGGRVAEA